MVHVVECSFIVAGVLPHQGQCLSRMPDMIAGSACCTAIANISIWRFHWKYRTSTLQEHHMHFTHFSPHTHCHRTWSRYTHAPPAAMKDKATAQPQTSNIARDYLNVTVKCGRHLSRPAVDAVLRQRFSLDSFHHVGDPTLARIAPVLHLSRGMREERCACACWYASARVSWSQDLSTGLWQWRMAVQHAIFA